MLTFHYHYQAHLIAFAESLDSKSTENEVTFVVERKKNALTLISGNEASFHMLTIKLGEDCSLKTGKFSINASWLKLCLENPVQSRNGESIHFHVNYDNRRLPRLSWQPESGTWRDGNAKPANETHLELLAKIQSTGFEPLSTCWLQSIQRHTNSHPKLSLFRLNQLEEKLEIVADHTLHSYEFPYQDNPRIDLKLDANSLKTLSVLCQNTLSHNIHVYADDESAIFSDEVMTIGVVLNFLDTDIDAKPIQYKTETQFSIDVSGLCNELASHQKVDTLKLLNNTLLYVCPTVILISGASEDERCSKHFESKVLPSKQTLLYTLTSTEFKNAITQFKKLGSKEMYLQVLIAPDGSRVLGLYKHTESKFPYSTVGIELYPEGLEEMTAEIEFHKTIEPAQGDLFSSCAES
ncbi:hypothetical protein JCM19231_1818 [Vibrio ishigakensis]|uniref:Uncharacterized protein n=1 Tax=Vibrio ishigakensis TaxID=1481914 RepID=A0A0B8P4T5_9VIBR|nr:hypothetical protein [Vibrio ishigakensis]GAM59607.1 hypothetical protein JCM19231_1818 [Vibrio ishigakensis]